MSLLALPPSAAGLALLLSWPTADTPPRTHATWVERQVHVMGTSLVVRARAATSAAAAAAAEAGIRAVERVDAQLSTWRDDTPLARLNGAPPGEPVGLDDDVLGSLREVAAIGDSTGGAFDPTLGALIDAWDLRGAGRVPAPAALAAAREAVGWRWFRLDAHHAERRHAAAWIDSGAFGKGAALRAARGALLAAGADAAVVNFGGQVLVLTVGTPEHRRVAVAAPDRRDRPAAHVDLTAGSLATTGQSERTLVIDGEDVGHVLDPRTGRPVPAWGSVTVLDADPLRADVLSTALFVLGPHEGRAWAERHEVAALFLVRSDGGHATYATPALRRAGFEEER